MEQTPYFAARKRAGERGAGPQHALDVANVMEQFITTTDERVTERHVDMAAAKQDSEFPRVK